MKQSRLWPTSALWRLDRCVTHRHGGEVFMWTVRGDDKQGRPSFSSPLLSFPGMSVISHPYRTAEVACLRSVAYFPRALKQNGNELNLFLGERLSDFN